MLDVMVSQHDEGCAKPVEYSAKQSFTAGPRNEIARHAYELWFPLVHPFHSALDGVRATRRQTEMEVRQVRDANPLELARQSRQRAADLARAGVCRRRVSRRRCPPGVAGRLWPPA